MEKECWLVGFDQGESGDIPDGRRREKTKVSITLPK